MDSSISIQEANNHFQQPAINRPSFFGRFSFLKTIATAAVAPFFTHSSAASSQSTESANSSDWEAISLPGDTQIENVLGSWIETEDGLSNKGQRRLAAKAIREFIDSPDQTTLDLKELDLVSLPDIFFHSAFTARLKILHLEENFLASLPPSLENLQSLQKIHGISIALLSEIPVELAHTLEIIHIEHSDEFPLLRVEGASLLTQWVNKGTAIENRQEAQKRIIEFMENPSLSILDLTDLHLHSLPEIFDHAAFTKRLETLLLSGNPLQPEGIPKSVNALQNLRFIQFEDVLSNLDNWALEEAPGEQRLEAWLRIIEFMNDEDGDSLDLSGLNLSSLPHIFSHRTFIEQLTSLDLSYNQLLEIPSTIFLPLRNLQSLNLEHNRLTEIDDTLCQIHSLKELWLAQNQLYILPRKMGDLCQLEWLDISQNALEELPESLANCTQLRDFNCSQNEIAEISREFGSLPYLRTFNVADNAFTEFSPGLLYILNSKGVEVKLFTLDQNEMEQTVIYRY